MREALERLKASSITSSSIRFSFTGGAGRLHHEDVGAAHVVLDLEPDLAVAEARQVRAAERHPKIAGDRLAQRRVRAAGEDLQFSACHVLSLNTGVNPAATP